MSTNSASVLPATPAQVALLAHLHSFPRAKLERTIEALIAICDLIDGDPEDHQSDGDELDGTFGEDDFVDHGHNWHGHAGCPIADPGGCEHDGREPEEG